MGGIIKKGEGLKILTLSSLSKKILKLNSICFSKNFNIILDPDLH